MITIIGDPPRTVPGERLLPGRRGHDGKGFTPAHTDLAIAFAFWCLPQILFYAMYSLLGEVLNAKQVFGPFTWAPLINNVIAIVGLVVFIAHVRRTET